MTNDFNGVTPFYDYLKKLVFGDRLFISECFALDEVKDTLPKEILIIGGGTGRILIEVLRRFPSARVTYLDRSRNMIRKASNRLKGAKADVNFICSDFKEYRFVKRFDMIITNFFLDCFTEKDLPPLVNKGVAALSTNGFWLFTDFIHSDQQVHKSVVRIMYLFFTAVARLESRHLPQYKALFTHPDLAHIGSSSFLNGLVLSKVMQKT